MLLLIRREQLREDAQILFMSGDKYSITLLRRQMRFRSYQSNLIWLKRISLSQR